MRLPRVRRGTALVHGRRCGTRAFTDARASRPPRDRVLFVEHARRCGAPFVPGGFGSWAFVVRSAALGARGVVACTCTAVAVTLAQRCAFAPVSRCAFARTLALTSRQLRVWFPLRRIALAPRSHCAPLSRLRWRDPRAQVAAALAFAGARFAAAWDVPFVTRAARRAFRAWQPVAFFVCWRAISRAGLGALSSSEFAPLVSRSLCERAARWREPRARPVALASSLAHLSPSQATPGKASGCRFL